MSLINLGTNPYPWPIDGRLGDPDLSRRAARLREARLAIEHTGPFAYSVVDLDLGPVGHRRILERGRGARAPVRGHARRGLTGSFPQAGEALGGRSRRWPP